MAKLSSHGYEIARLKTVIDGPSDSPEIARRDIYRSYRSDGHIMRRMVVLWRDGMRHDYGWTLYKRFKARAPVGASKRAFGNRSYVVSIAPAVARMIDRMIHRDTCPAYVSGQLDSAVETQLIEISRAQ